MSRSSVQTHLSPDLATAHQLVLGVERFRCVCVCAYVLACVLLLGYICSSVKTRLLAVYVQGSRGDIPAPHGGCGPGRCVSDHRLCPSLLLTAKTSPGELSDRGCGCSSSECCTRRYD